MSHSTKSPGPEKSSQCGTLRIFRQSVKELGHLTKSNAATLGNEIINSRKEKLNEQKAISENEEVKLESLDCKEQDDRNARVGGKVTSKTKGTVKSKTIEPTCNTKEEIRYRPNKRDTDRNERTPGLRKYSSYNHHSTPSKQGSNEFLQTKPEHKGNSFNSFTTKGEFSDFTLKVPDDANGTLECAGVSVEATEFRQEFSIAELVVENAKDIADKTKFSLLEDWVKEPHIGSNVPFEKLKLDPVAGVYACSQVEAECFTAVKVHNDFEENKPKHESDLNNNVINGIGLDNVGLILDAHSGNKVDVKSETGIIESSLEESCVFKVNRQALKERKCDKSRTRILENKQIFEEFSAEHLPCHSTPKKVQTLYEASSHHKSIVSEVEPDGVVSVQSLRKQTENEIEDENISVDPTGSNLQDFSWEIEVENNSKIKRNMSRYSAKQDSDRRGDNSSKIECETISGRLKKDTCSRKLEPPPQFKGNSWEKKMTSRPNENQNCVSNFEHSSCRRGFSRARSGFNHRGFDRSTSYNYYTKTFDQPTSFQRKDRMKGDCGHTSLWTSRQSNIETWPSRLRNVSKSQWTLPMSEDWISEIEKTEASNNKVMDINKVHLATGPWQPIKHAQQLTFSTKKNEKSKKKNQMKGKSDIQTVELQIEKINETAAGPEITENTFKEVAEILQKSDVPKQYLPPPPPGYSLGHILDGMGNSTIRLGNETQESAEKELRNSADPAKINIPYLPPIPIEVIESGAEESWTSENHGKSAAKDVHVVANCEVLNEPGIGASPYALVENRLNQVVTENCVNDPIHETEKREYLHEKENNIASKARDNVTKNVQCNASLKGGDNCFEKECDIAYKDIDGIVTTVDDDRVVTEDSSSVYSRYVRGDHTCVYSGIGNMTSQADVSDIPFDLVDASKPAENDLDRLSNSEGFHYVKSFEKCESGLYTTDEQAVPSGYDVGRENYEQYARYWYGQNLVNLEIMQRDQFGPWYPNYPYNYEIYRGWCYIMQYNEHMRYYLEMGNWERQYTNQMQEYYGAVQNSSPAANQNKEMRRLSEVNSGKAAKATDNVKGRKSSGHSVNKDKNDVCYTESHQSKEDNRKNIVDRKLSEYWSKKRMHQWVKSQSAEKNSDEIMPAKQELLCLTGVSEGTSEGTNRSLKKEGNAECVCVDAGNHSNEMNTVLPAGVKQHSNLTSNLGFGINELNLEKLEIEKTTTHSSTNNENNTRADAPCSCKPAQIQFMVWRQCKCGKPPKLHQILPCNHDDRSLDLGYQSYESLEHDESTLSKAIGKKAPGFVIQPLCSTPTIEGRNIQLLSKGEKDCQRTCKRETSKELQEAVGESVTAGVRPPPGFEHAVHTALTQSQISDMKQNYYLPQRPGSEASRDPRTPAYATMENNQNNKQPEVFSDPPSLTNVLQRHNLENKSRIRHANDIKRELHTQKDQPTLSNVETDYSALPTCLSKSATHLSKAVSSMHKAEIVSEGLRVVSKRICEIQHEMQHKIIEDGNVETSEMKTTVTGDEVGRASIANNANKVLQGCLNELKTTGRNMKEIVNRGESIHKRVIENCGQRMDLNGNDYEMDTRVYQNKLSNIRESGLEYGSVVKSELLKGHDRGQLYSSAVNQSFSSARPSLEDYSEMSCEFRILTQSPQESDSEQVDVCSFMGDTNLFKESLDDNGKEMSKGCSYELEDYEIPLNELIDKENVVNTTVKDSGMEKEAMSGVRMPYSPRFPFFGLPPPYRGGCTYRPPYMPSSHLEECSHDPRMLSLLPPPLQHQRPSPFAMQHMISPKSMYGPGVPWDTSRSFLDSNASDNRMCGDENPRSRFQYPSYPSRDAYREPTKFSPSERRESDEARNLVHTRSNPVALVDYPSTYSSSGSSPDIEPFDLESLHEEENGQKNTNTLKPMFKKLKTDDDGDNLSVDSMDMGQEENYAYMLENSKTSSRLIRGHPKKLKQKSLKSFSAGERPPPIPRQEDTPIKILKDHNKKRTLSEIIAETIGVKSLSGNKLDSDCVGAMEHKFPPVGAEPEKQLADLPPLPPFPNSTFWNMYTPASTSALTGKSPEEKYPRPSWSAPRPHRSQYSSPFRRYSFSAGQSGGETNSETTAICNDWKTNFKMFHNFGVKYIDTHCHLDFLFSREGFKGSFKAYMDKRAETFPELFEGCVAVFCNPSTFTPSSGLWLEVAKEPNVWVAMGCHPKMATDFTAAAELGLKKCLHHSKCIALGEIGLDYSGTFYVHAEVQKQVFRRQLQLAVDMQKVLVIHSRQAEDDCLGILKEMVPRNWKIHCHCFTNAYSNAKLWTDAFPNLFIGVTPLVTYRTAKSTHDLARNIPLNRLLLETDAPYFIPRCIPKEDLLYSTPGLAVTVAKEIAQYQEVPVATVLRQCRLNTKFMYGI